MNQFYTKSILILALFLMTVPFAQARTSVINNISVKTHTGGNSSQNGSVVEGESTTTIDIVTHNGDEVVHEVHKTETGSGAEIEYTVLAQDDTVTVTNERIKVEQKNTTSPEGMNTQTEGEMMTNTESKDIISINKASEDLVDESGHTTDVQTSFFARISSAVSNTFAYVLSIFFS